MKIIVCTGDSHTCGTGVERVKPMSLLETEDITYNISGKGTGRGDDFAMCSYVNLVRQYITEHTASTSSVIDGETLAEMTGYPVRHAAVRLEGALRLKNTADLSVICFAEQCEEAEAAIYLDGVLFKKELLHTPIPRFNEWSFRSVPVPCAGAKELQIVPLRGEVYISHIQQASGAYAVINSGVGSTTSKRYLDECFPYCVEAFRPDLIIAEAHTVNDWLRFDHPEQHRASLEALVQKMRSVCPNILFMTVSPILGDQNSPSNGIDYHDFVDASRKIGALEGVSLADANLAIQKVLDAIPAEEHPSFYSNSWHVNGKGHRIYADCLIDALKGVLPDLS